MDQEIVSAIPSSRNAIHRRRADSGRERKGAFTGQDVGGSVVQEVASLEANGGRTSDQRMMVNGVALSSMIAGGWGGGAVPNATGTAEFAIDVSAVDAQAATGGVRINFIPRDGGNRFSGTIVGSFATESFASDNFTGSDVQQRGLSVPGHDQGERRLQSRLRRAASSATSCGSSSPAASCSPTTTSPGCSSTRTRTTSNRYDYVRSTGPGRSSTRSSRSSRAASPGRRARSTRSASPSTRRTSARARPASAVSGGVTVA